MAEQLSWLEQGAHTSKIVGSTPTSATKESIIKTSKNDVFLFFKVYNGFMGLIGKIAGKFVKDRTANTKTALQLIVEDFKRYVLALKLIFLCFSFFMPTYTSNLRKALCTKDFR